MREGEREKGREVIRKGRELGHEGGRAGGIEGHRRLREEGLRVGGPKRGRLEGEMEVGRYIGR